MMSILGNIFGFLLKMFFGPKGAKIEDIAASNATNQAAVAGLEAGNDEMQKAGAARADADNRRLRERSGGGIDPSSGKSIDDDPNGHWRD